MSLNPNDYRNRVCLNVLPGSKQQAVVEGHI
ncbi:4-hydroxy-2-ketovalerate aldolase [Aeromonas salmonicida]|nr:KDGP aldolase family protein [Aeromonas salmonicida]VFB11913.1 4-hydroxy-2-ketovalerate aldolase [Aeromonas salmonicida]